MYWLGGGHSALVWLLVLDDDVRPPEHCIHAKFQCKGSEGAAQQGKGMLDAAAFMLPLLMHATSVMHA